MKKFLNPLFLSILSIASFIAILSTVIGGIIWINVNIDPRWVAMTENQQQEAVEKMMKIITESQKRPSVTLKMRDGTTAIIFRNKTSGQSFWTVNLDGPQKKMFSSLNPIWIEENVSSVE